MSLKSVQKIRHPKPLLSSERGRGSSMTSDRIEEMERYCAKALSSGMTQIDIQNVVNASGSRVSRWCISGLQKYGTQTDHRRLKRGDKTLTQMMWARIQIDGPDKCWRWRGAIKPNGYGVLNFRGKAANAHKLVYETLIGTVPDGLVIDHKCSNPACVNPEHLHVVTHSVNMTLSVIRGGRK